MDPRIIYLIRVKSHVTGILSRVSDPGYDILAVRNTGGLTLCDVYTDNVVDEGLEVDDILCCNMVRSIATARVSGKVLTLLRDMKRVSMYESLLHYFEHRSSVLMSILKNSIINKSSSSEVDALNLNATSIHVHYERCFMAFSSLLPTLVSMDGMYDLIFCRTNPTCVKSITQDLDRGVSIKSRSFVMTFSSTDPDLSSVPTQELGDIVIYVNSLESRTETLLCLSRAAAIELSRRR